MTYWRNRKKQAPLPPSRPCEWDGCDAPGECRAPKSPNQLRSYYWFCQPHAAAYNKAWNFFDGMSAEEAELYRVEAVTGHRPTWKIGITPQQAEQQVAAKLFAMTGEGIFADYAEQTPAISRQTRTCLKELELTFPTSKQAVKKQYKQLVKQHHPDTAEAHQDAEAAAERFRRISEAYKFLARCPEIPD